MFADNPETVIDSDVPATDGVGSPVTAVAELKFPEVIAEVEYRKS